MYSGEQHLYTKGRGWQGIQPVMDQERFLRRGCSSRGVYSSEIRVTHGRAFGGAHGTFSGCSYICVKKSLFVISDTDFDADFVRIYTPVCLGNVYNIGSFWSNDN